MTLLASLAAFVAFPVLAYTGKGYRGLYFAGALAAFLVGLFVLSVAGTDVEPMTEAQALGREAMQAYGPSVGGWFVVSSLGLAIGGLAFRSKR